MQLYFQTYPETASDPDLNVISEQGLWNTPATPVIIIPGLFGSTTNWRSFARALSADVPVIVIDQRNHGQSPHADSHSYADMVNDLLRLLDKLALDKVYLCGHSMGGKTAMLLSLLHPERVAKLMVLDIAPERYSHSHAPFLEALMQIDLSTLKSRSEADQAVKAAIPETSTRLFLLQSLTGSAGQYRWRLNLPVLHEFMPEITGFPDNDTFLTPCLTDTLFVAGGKSDYIKGCHYSRMNTLFPNAEHSDIADAGHWLHVEQPKAVLTTIMEFLKK